MMHIENFEKFDNDFGTGKPKSNNFRYVIIKPSNKFSKTYNKFINCHIATVLENYKETKHIYAKYDEEPYKFTQHFYYEDIKYYSNNREVLEMLLDSENFNL